MYLQLLICLDGILKFKQYNTVIYTTEHNQKMLKSMKQISQITFHKGVVCHPFVGGVRREGLYKLIFSDSGREALENEDSNIILL